MQQQIKQLRDLLDFLELRAKHNVSHSAIDFIAKNIDTIFKDVAQFCDLETNLTLTNIEKATSQLNSHQKRIRFLPVIWDL